jgi:hypothetical protein
MSPIKLVAKAQPTGNCNENCDKKWRYIKPETVKSET